MGTGSRCDASAFLAGFSAGSLTGRSRKAGSSAGVAAVVRARPGSGGRVLGLWAVAGLRPLARAAPRRPHAAAGAGRDAGASRCADGNAACRSAGGPGRRGFLPRRERSRSCGRFGPRSRRRRCPSSRRAMGCPISFSIAATLFSSRRVDQHEGMTGASGAAGAADAMDVIVGLERHVEIEDVADRRNVEAAGRDVARDKQADLAGAERIERLRAHRLIEIAVQRARRRSRASAATSRRCRRRACDCRRRWRSSRPPRGSGGAALRASPSRRPERVTAICVMVVAAVAGARLRCGRALGGTGRSGAGFRAAWSPSRTASAA